MLEMTKNGLFCRAGNFYIDPKRKVDLAVITHAHSDHARRGSSQYFCTPSSVDLLKKRLGEKSNIQSIDYRSPFKLGPVWISFHPAGHILGSAQVRVEYGSQVWVVSGDYKREADPTCAPFEVVPCDTFLTESTFAQPSYRWLSTSDVIQDIYKWWIQNSRSGRNSLLYCYALGKAQRILAELTQLTERKVLVFGETAELTDCYRNQGVHMLPTENLESYTSQNEKISGELILAPHSINKTDWVEQLNPRTGFASGWMQTGAFGSWTKYDRGFVLSDHADWPGLIRTIEETGAKKVYMLYGSAEKLQHTLLEKGIRAEPVPLSE